MIKGESYKNQKGEDVLIISVHLTGPYPVLGRKTDGTLTKYTFKGEVCKTPTGLEKIVNEEDLIL